MARGLVTLIGGSGFVGRYAARALVEAGWRVRVACRRPFAAQDVKVAGPPGWVDLVQANIRNRESIARAVDGADAVVNLVGILFERGKQNFQDAQYHGAGLVAEVAAEAGITRFVQISAIGANETGKAEYARTKAKGEAAVREHLPGAVILRPSIVFGPEDQFFNRFAQLAKMSPALPSIGFGKTRFQPVYAGDVADAIAAAVEREDALGQTFELGGPRTYSFNELYDFIFETIQRPRLKVPLPFFVAKPMGMLSGALFRWVPPLSWGLFGDPPITGGQVDLLRTDNVVAD
ncbi:MAG: complex I NDUFA9 subunit family protein, partial [Pseudomonadota bacterium]